MNRKRQSISILILIAIVVGVVSLPSKRSQALSNTVTITVAVQSFSANNFTDSLIKDFETAHPDINLKFVTQDSRITSATSSLDTHFSDLQKYVSAADVVSVDSNSLSVESTLAGYFLDLSPLASSDNSLNTADFYPTIWQAFQWNKGIWAIPTGANVYVMTYQASAFDKANLTYPTESWTIDNLVAAVDKLTVKDANGKVVQKGLALAGGLSQQALFRSLIGSDLLDNSQVPNQPQLDTPAAETLLNAWETRWADGSIGFDTSTAPMTISSTQFLTRPVTSNSEKNVAVLLPGGKAGLDVQGFAVSKGTPYPDQAYTVAAFLSTRSESKSGFATTSARQSLAGQTTNTNGPPQNISADLQAVINKALPNGLTLSNFRFVDYLNTAIQTMQTNNVDAKSALQTVEVTVVANQNAAITKKDSVTINVATPVPVKLAANKITLNFAVQTSFGPPANQTEWTTLATNFAATDTQVGYINIASPGPQTQTADLAAKYDCFYTPNNQVQNINVKTILNLDPYLAADASFNKSNMVSGTMDQVTRDNKVWALPISLEPSILKYDVQALSKAGVTLPTNGWTVNSFADALKQLKVNPGDDAPFVPSGTGGNDLLILIASYGGLPIDYRTSPLSFNYTDPATVTAIQQVLDLAKNGYIKYTKLGSLGFNFGSAVTGATIYTTSLNAFNFGPGPAPSSSSTATSSTTTTTYNSVTYPKGTKYNGVSYSLGTAYISATTQNADACYRWISEIAKNPDLFSAMPAQRSLIDSTSQSAGVKALYTQMADLLADPNTVALPSLQGAQQSMFYQYWLFQAFDNYVLNNGDLTSALKDAQDKSVGLSQCVATLPAFDGSNPNDYFKQYTTCVSKVDSALASAFN